MWCTVVTRCCHSPARRDNELEAEVPDAPSKLRLVEKLTALRRKHQQSFKRTMSSMWGGTVGKLRFATKSSPGAGSQSEDNDNDSVVVTGRRVRFHPDVTMSQSNIRAEIERRRRMRAMKRSNTTRWVALLCTGAASPPVSHRHTQIRGSVLRRSKEAKVRTPHPCAVGTDFSALTPLPDSSQNQPRIEVRRRVRPRSASRRSVQRASFTPRVAITARGKGDAEEPPHTNDTVRSRPRY